MGFFQFFNGFTSLTTGRGPKRIAPTTAADLTALGPDGKSPARFIFVLAAGRIIGTDEEGEDFDTVEEVAAGVYLLHGARSIDAATTATIYVLW